jgi:sporulation integral membrane protein YtvI
LLPIFNIGEKVTKEFKVFLGVLMIGIALVAILKYLFSLLAPFLLGIIFACLIEPLVEKVDIRLKVGRKFAVSLILVALVITVFAVTGFSLLAFYQEAQRLIPQIPQLVNRLLNIFREILEYGARYFPQLTGIDRNFGLPSESIGQVLRSLILGVIQFLPRFPQLLFAVGLGGVTAYFFSRDKKLISQLFYRVLPHKWQPATVELKTEVLTSVSRFIRVECILALISTSLTMAFFAFLNTPAAVAYGFLAGILDFLPVLGPGLVYIPLAVMHLLFHNYCQAILLICAYFLLLLVRQVAEFKLIGENLNLHPLVSIFVIYIGIQLFGFAGILFGPLLVIILRALYRVLMGLEKQLTNNY